jgi:hypothetical protein
MSFYLTARFDDLGKMFRNVFSPANIEMLASLLPQEDTQEFRLMANMASQIPAKSVALLVGMIEDGTFFQQIAVSMPDSVRPKLDRVAKGKASPEDLVTLVLGEGGLLLAGGFQPTLQQGAEGPYYLLDGTVALTARDGLLVVASSPAELEASLEAMKKAENRLVVRRRFKSSDYSFLHMDMPTLFKLVQKESPEEAKDIDVNAMLSLFKAPLEYEVAFNSKPGSVLISSGINISEAIVSHFLKNITPVKMFLAGGGKLLLGGAGGIVFRIADLKIYPKFAQTWNGISKSLEARGITEKDVEDFLTGSVTLAYGNEAMILGNRVPGGYIAFTGQNGAASRIWNKILEDESFSQAIPMSPSKVEGWESVLTVDPTLFPASLVAGVSKDTFFLGIADPKELGKTPELSPESAKLLKEDCIGMGFFDVGSTWAYVKQNAAAIVALAPNVTPDDLEIVNAIVDAELPMSFIKIWAPTLEEFFLEIFTADVPSEKRLLPKIVKTLENLTAKRSQAGSDNAEETDGTEETYEEYSDWPATEDLYEPYYEEEPKE